MSFVNSKIVPYFLNNPLIKVILFLIVIYVYYQDKLISILLGFMIVLTLSLSDKTEKFNNGTGQCSEDTENYNLTQYQATLYPPINTN